MVLPGPVGSGASRTLWAPCQHPLLRAVVPVAPHPSPGHLWIQYLWERQRLLEQCKKPRALLGGSETRAYSRSIQLSEERGGLSMDPSGPSHSRDPLLYTVACHPSDNTCATSHSFVSALLSSSRREVGSSGLKQGVWSLGCRSGPVPSSGRQVGSRGLQQGYLEDLVGAGTRIPGFFPQFGGGGGIRTAGLGCQDT